MKNNMPNGEYYSISIWRARCPGRKRYKGHRVPSCGCLYCWDVYVTRNGIDKVWEMMNGPEARL